MPSKYKENLNYHSHRTHRFTKASKEQKEFSEGYIDFGAMVTMDDHSISTKEKNEYLSYQMEIAKNPKHKEHNIAKGFIASMFDFKKQIPKNLTIWGNPKTENKRRK